MATRQTRIALASLAVVVLIGVAVLLVMLRKGDGDTKPSRKVATAESGPAPVPTRDPGVLRTERSPGERPTITKQATPRAAHTDFRTSVTDDGVVVRDHRGEGAAEVTAPMRVPASAGKMKPLAIASVRDALRPMVRKCEAQHAPEVDGDRPELQAVVRVTVTGDRIIAGETEVSVRDAKADALLDCVKAAAKDIDIPAKGHADIANYALTFPFRLAR